MSQVLVTGGLGFLGGHVAQALVDRGHRVRIFARSGGPTASREPPAGCELIWGDVRDAGAVTAAACGMEVVIHTVSNFRRGGSDRGEARAVNVDGALNVCRATRAAGARRLVHISTIGVHGDVEQIPADEETPFNPGDLYQETKLEGERKVREYALAEGLPTAVVRPISLFGPGDTRMLKLFRMIKKRRFVMVGDGQALFQPAYIDDVVAGILLCMESETAPGQVFILGGEEYLTLERLVAMIAGELGVAPPRLRVPLKPVLALAGLCESVCVPLGLEPPLHRRRISFFHNNRAFRVDKAKRLLHYHPRVSLREGLRRTIDWYESAGWLH